MFTFITSLFHSLLLIFKLAAITTLWMILVELCGHTSSSRKVSQLSSHGGRGRTARGLTKRTLTRGNPLPLSKCTLIRIPLPQTQSLPQPEAFETVGETISVRSPVPVAPARTGSEKKSKTEHEKAPRAERRRSRASTLSSEMSTGSSTTGGTDSSSSRSSSRAANVGTRGVSSSPEKSRSRERRSLWRRERSSGRTSKIAV